MAAERRPQILQAAARVVAARGLTGMRLADVAKEAGLSIGTVQHYFGSRQQLLVETFAYEAERSLERWLPAERDGVSAWDQLLHLVDIWLDPPTFRERWTRWVQFWAVYAREPKLRGAMGKVYARWREPIRQMIEAGIASGDLAPSLPVDVVVDRTVALFDGLALQVLVEAPGMSLERMRELVVDGLAADLGVDGRSQSFQKGARAARAASIPSRPRAGSSGT
jgi:AcrR family transcriptional regulator